MPENRLGVSSGVFCIAMALPRIKLQNSISGWCSLYQGKHCVSQPRGSLHLLQLHKADLFLCPGKYLSHEFALSCKLCDNVGTCKSKLSAGPASCVATSGQWLPATSPTSSGNTGACTTCTLALHPFVTMNCCARVDHQHRLKNCHQSAKGRTFICFAATCLLVCCECIDSTS